MLSNIQNSCLQVDYRNAFYQGQLTNLKRFGFGILITDNHCLFIANWHNNQLKGSYCFLSPKTKAFGEIVQRKLQNFNVIQSQGKVIYGNYENGLLEGIGVIITKQFCNVNSYHRGMLMDKIQTCNLSKGIKQKILYQYFPENYHKFEEYLNGMLNHSDIVENKISCKKIVLTNKQTYYGFCDLHNNPKGLGLIFKNGMLYSLGQYKNNKLHGLGTINLNREQFHDGQYVNGILTGIGIKYNQITNTFLIGKFNIEDEKVQKRYGYPSKEILQIKKHYHLQSANFIDQTIVSQFIIKLNLLKLNSIHSESSNSILRKSSVKKSDDSINKFNNIKYNNAKIPKIYPVSSDKTNSKDDNPENQSPTINLKYKDVSLTNSNLSYVTPIKNNNLNNRQPQQKRIFNKQQNLKLQNSNNQNFSQQRPNKQKQHQPNNFFRKTFTQQTNQYFQQRDTGLTENYGPKQIKKKSLNQQYQHQGKYYKYNLQKSDESIKTESKFQIQKKSKMKQQFLYQQQKRNLSSSQIMKKSQKNIVFQNNVLEKSPLTQQTFNKYIRIFIQQINGNKSQLQLLYNQLLKITDQIFKKTLWLVKTSISIMNNKHQILFELCTNDYQYNWISCKKYHIYVGQIASEQIWNKQKLGLQKHLFMKGRVRASLIQISQK